MSNVTAQPFDEAAEGMRLNQAVALYTERVQKYKNRPSANTMGLQSECKTAMVEALDHCGRLGVAQFERDLVRALRVAKVEVPVPCELDTDGDGNCDRCKASTCFAVGGPIMWHTKPLPTKPLSIMQQRALEYVRNTGGNASVETFIEDHDPVGKQLWAELTAMGLAVVGDRGKVCVTIAGRARLGEPASPDDPNQYDEE